jgi:microcystin degradation protein MlrC
MRIAIGQLWQETNTFNRNPTRVADFENWGVATGPAVLERFGKTGELGGFVDGCRQWQPDVELVGLARLACWPWGRVDREAWVWIQQTFAAALKQMGRVDGVLLALHGAMAAEGEDDVTGALLAQVRRMIGPDIPLVGTLDLHANITQAMMAHADILTGYHTSPHLDHYETGQRGVRGLRAMLEQQVRPTKIVRKLPMITPAETHNSFTGPPAPLYRQLEAWERQPEVLSAGLYMAMPWLDCAELGWTVTLHVTENAAKWEKAAYGLGAECWALRETMSQVERVAPPEVVSTAMAVGGHPVVVGDGADATNSGSPGDSTVLLREFLRNQPIPYGALTFLVDPEAVTTATRAGVGGNFDAFVGATFAPEFSQPVRMKGTVEKLVDVRFELNGHGGKNMPISMGRGAVVRSGDVTVLFTEGTGPGSSPQVYRAAGLEPKDFGIVVAKSPAGFRADYEPFASAILLADCPGCATPNWHRLKFQKVNRPLWPLEDIESVSDAEWVD